MVGTGRAQKNERVKPVKISISQIISLEKLILHFSVRFLYTFNYNRSDIKCMSSDKKDRITG